MLTKEANPVLSQDLTWFFVHFQQKFRRASLEAFELLMLLAFAHLFGLYNPKQLADSLGVPHQKLYAHLKDWSLYYLKEMLVCFMVKQAAEQLRPLKKKVMPPNPEPGLPYPLITALLIGLANGFAVPGVGIVAGGKRS